MNDVLYNITLGLAATAIWEVGKTVIISLKKNDKQITEFQIHSNKNRIPFLKKSSIANSDY